MRAGDGQPPVRTRRQSVPRVGLRVWLIWCAGVLVYLLGVAQRTSLGAAGLEAAAHFSINPGMLSVFVFIQVTTYAIGQIPAGLLVDRFGPRTMLLAAGIMLALGQATLALATALPVAVLGRVLIGAGDALAFASALALVPRWFPAERVPVITQTTALVGPLGQVLSAVPLLLLLHEIGWSAAFGVAAGACVVSGVVAFVVVRDGSGARTSTRPGPRRALLHQIAVVWRRPGTRLGFFGHLGTQFSMMTFQVLWGFPYLVSAQGRDPLAAGVLMTVLVVAALCMGPVVGFVAARHPFRRSWLLLAVIAITAATWTVVLALPAPAPTWLLVILVIVLATGGPGSIVGFDIARTANPSESGAAGLGIVNTGGYSATLLVLAAMAAILSTSGGFTAEAFRIAWLVQYPVWAFAVVGILRTRREARSFDASQGVVPRRMRDVLAGSRCGRRLRRRCRPKN